MRIRKWGTAPLIVALVGVTAVGLSTAPAGAAGFTVRASSSTTGGEGNAISTGATLSDDGRYVAFSSAASNLVAGDTNGFGDVFVFDRHTLTTTLVSRDSVGGPADGASESAWISGNGQYVAFASLASDLVAGDTNGASDIFVRDLLANTTTRVSVTTAGAQVIDGDSFEPSISDDGTKVEFSSDSSTLVVDDLNDSEDVFVRNRTANTTTRVSVATNGDETDFGAYEGVISGDGTIVVFTTDTGLLTTDGNDLDDVYRHAISTGTTTRVSSDTNPLGGGGWTGHPSDDGQVVAFASDAPLGGPGTDTNFLPDIYVRDFVAGNMRRISIPGTTGLADNLSLSPTISDDGRYVAYFTLATNLGAVDTNGTFDVWLRDRTLSTNTRVSQDVGGADPDGAAELPFISGNGAFVGFQSLATDLGPTGETSNVDIYVRSLANDTTNPTVSITTPAAAATYARGATINANYSCSDDVGGSGIVSCAGPVATGSPIDTATLGPKSFTVTATDGQGNTASVTRNYTVVDQTAPTITVTAPIDGATFTQYATVFADYACADEASGSGLASCVGTVADGAAIDTATLGAHTFTVNAADVAGNTSSTTVNYTVLDAAGPDITITTPVDGATYARGATVLADFACTDEVGGSGVASCVGTVADGAAINTATLGAHSFTVNASDNSGNNTTRTHNYTVTDQSPPTITLTTPVDAADYGRGSSVIADYACTDDVGGSGIATCSGTVADGAAIDTATLGSHGFTVNATDGAGNPASVSVNYNVVDVTDPTASITTPVDGASYARGSTVAADYVCSDDVGGSGVASCVGTVADGSAIDTATLGPKSFAVVATDAAGNSSTTTVNYTVVDQTAPTATITTPADGATYSVGQSVTADYACADEVGGSGVASCVGPVADGAAINTASPGSFSFAVVATDNAGNSTTETVNYTVANSTTVSVGDFTTVENDSGTQTAKVTVVLNDPAAAQTSVHYATQSTGSAGSSDFKAKSGTLIFQPGQVTKTLSFTLTPDTVVEADETFDVVLDTPVGMAIGDATGVVTILDDDVTAGQRVSASDGTTYEGNGGSTRKVFFVVALAQPSAGGVSVHYSVTGATATGGTSAGVGTDFKLRSGTLAFSAGQRFKVVAVTVYGDTVVEGNETLVINLDTPTGTAIHRGAGTGTIATDD